MVAPIMRGIMSRMTPPDKQGKFMEFFLQIDSVCETVQLVGKYTCMYLLVIRTIIMDTKFIFPLNINYFPKQS